MQLSALDNEGYFNVSSQEWTKSSTLSKKPRSFVYSADGSHVALLFEDWYFIVKSSVSVFKDGQLELELPCSGVVEAEFSPRSTWISTWTRYTKSADGKENFNLVVWNVETGESALRLVQKLQNSWNVQWSTDESICARVATNEIQIYSASAFEKGISHRIKVEGISSFSISSSLKFATFVPEKKGLPASVKLYSLDKPDPIAQKSFFRADSANFLWNASATAVLIQTHTDVDKTGQSYYGETNLYYLSSNGSFDCKVELKKPGPVHDVHWNPNSLEFIVIYGTMPAKATIFDHRAAPLFEFPPAARNFVRFCPKGRLICTAGFGNLAGEMDFWDRRSLKKISSINASNTSTCEWSPDGRFVMNSTLYKRLKVDNGLKIYHYTGVLVHHLQSKELYQSAWKPCDASSFPERLVLSPPPPGIIDAAPVKKEAYRPPGARNGPAPDIFNRSAVKKKPVQVLNTDAADREKKVKQLQKKLRQVQDLKERQLRGESLEVNQLAKIQSEASLLKELQVLSLNK